MKKLLITTTAIAALFALSGCGEVIDTGNRGIKKSFGELVGEPLPEGLYFYNPMTTASIVAPGFTVNATGAVTATLPTSAGGSGLFVCVDTSGVFYKKSTCP